MRIVYVIEKLSGIGGMERITIDKMNYLAEHTNHEIVLLLVWHDNEPFLCSLSHKVSIVRLNVPYIHKLVLPKLFALYRYNKEIRRLSPDVTIYIWTMGAFLAAFTTWRGKSIYESHLARHAMMHKWVITMMERKVDAVVSLTKGDAQEFCYAKRVVVIPNMTRVHVEGTPRYEKKNCLIMGRLTYQKNLQRLISLWNLTIVKHPDWHLNILGDGPDNDVLQKQIEDDGLNNKVKIIPFTYDVVPFTLENSIYIMTSRFEGLPMALIEAQASGLPIIAFNCPYGPADIIEDGKTGFLIPYDDDQAFIAKLSKLMDDEDLRHRMGKAAKVASQRYQPALIMEQWLQLFSELG